MKQTWTWQQATGADVAECVTQAQLLFEIENPEGSESRQIFDIDPTMYGYRITQAIVSQFYDPGSNLFMVARHQETGCLMAQTWAERGKTALWSRAEIASIQIAHVDYELPVITKMRLIGEMLDLWDAWALGYGIPIIHSNTMRQETSAFLRLHQRRGYQLRGNSAYKRLSI